jgi:membrane protease YdiL (CAAX protease family)
MERHTYRPVRFYTSVFACTWLFWSIAIRTDDETAQSLAMLLGLLSPAVVAIATVLASKDERLRRDFKRKMAGLRKLSPGNLLIAIAVFVAIIAASILLSTAFGQSLDQFALTDDFSFTGAGIGSALLTILLASVIEEVGWRGYGEDAIAQYCSWFKESVIFGAIWALWHLPLFWIPGSYQYGLRILGAGYMFNFLISVVPLGFLTTWVYVRNGRSMLASMIFHLFVNFLQERVAMTPETKCVETLVVVVAAAIVVGVNRNMFFETQHVGRLPDETQLHFAKTAMRTTANRSRP